MKEASVGVVVQQGKDIYGRESKLVLQQTVQVQVQVKVGLATLSRPLALAAGGVHGASRQQVLPNPALNHARLPFQAILPTLPTQP